MLHNLTNDEMEKVREADSYDQAIFLAKRSGKVPKGWNVAISEANDERIIVVCKKGEIITGEGVKPAVTAPKAKPKKTALPEKLTGVNSEAVFKPKAPIPDVPGILNTPIEPQHFKRCRPRPIDPLQGSWTIKLEILREQTREITIRKDAYQFEILSPAFEGIDLTEDERVKFVLKPLKMQDGAVFKVERISALARLALTVNIWDGSQRRCGVEVPLNATIGEIVREAQKKLDDTTLEEFRWYGVYYKNQITTAPWIQKEYELRATVDISGTVVVKCRTGDMTVPVPIPRPHHWQQIVFDSMPDPPSTVTQTGAREFRAVYNDEEILYHVRFLADGEGEEHVVSLLPLWENQRLRIAEAFGREMVQDTSRQSKDNVIFVKSADGSPPDPTFERVLAYTLGDDPAEFSVRVHKGETTRDIKAGLASLHKGLNPAKIIFEGSEMDDADAITDWATSTGTSPIRVQITLDTPMQKFWLWQYSGLKDLGSEDLDGRTRDQIWGSIQLRNPEVKAPREYRLFRGQEEVRWEDLPVQDLTLVPINIPLGNRGTEFKIVDHLSVKRPREVGPLVQMSYQIFTIEKTQSSEPIDIYAPNEISLPQLVTYFILPTGIQLDVSSVFYWNLREIEDTSAADKTKRRLKSIPDKIPPGFNLRVRCSSLHENSTKRMARCRFGSVPLFFAMQENALLGRLKERAIDWMNQRGQGTDWKIEGGDREPIDFDHEYEIIPAERELPVRIFLKQMELEVMPSLSWINLSDQLVKKKDLPKGTLFRIYHVTGSIDDRDAEDFSYSITWEADKQYWFDIVYDISKDRRDLAKQVLMVDFSGRTDTFVIPRTATAQQVADLWKHFLEVPADIGMNVTTGNGEEFYWGYVTTKGVTPFTFQAPNMHSDVNIFIGTPQFESDQIGRLLDLKSNQNV
jgi:hypothetical protein